METNERTAQSTVQERAQNEFLKEIAPKSPQLQDVNTSNFALIERTPCAPNGVGRIPTLPDQGFGSEQETFPS
jgi:hypothetical protein